MIKKGDTLIEVTIAIGIFSMVAIAVVSVVSSSTTGAQTALETTLAREEIDAQAEALRFIQSSYANSDTDTDNPYKTLWTEITKNTANAISYDTPSTCAELYDTDNPNSIFSANNRSFVIDTRLLGEPDGAEVLVRSIKDGKANTVFAEASTYPRLIYGSDDEALVGGSPSGTLSRVEGIYVTAVKGPSTIIAYSSTNVKEKVATYDFYIRTCWYGAGDNMPTTISTVVRLYDPDVVHSDSPSADVIAGGTAVPTTPTDPTGDDTPTDPTTPPSDTLPEHPYMQDLTLAQCQTYATSAPLTVYDRRDESDYTVRYINGACWMTQNLRITGVISSTDSNFTTSPYSGTSSIDTFAGGNLRSGPGSYTTPMAHLADATDVAYAANDTYGYIITTKEQGAWYNYCAASAGQVCARVEMDATQDICPAGWHLPSYNIAEGTFYSTGTGNSASNASLFSPVAGGYYGNGTNNGIYNAGYTHPRNGFWWTSTSSNRYDDGTTRQWSLYTWFWEDDNTYGMGTADYQSKSVGQYIRCVRTS